MSFKENGASNAIPKFDCHSDPATFGARWMRWLVYLIYLPMAKVSLSLRLQMQTRGNEEGDATPSSMPR